MENDVAKVFTADGSFVEAPSYLWELQYMAYTNRPLYIARLENDWWKESETLVNGIEKGWIEIVPDEGFVITEKGKDVLRFIPLAIRGSLGTIRLIMINGRKSIKIGKRKDDNRRNFVLTVSNEF
jgi:hypothetical protein